ncbi:MAG: ABC transporter ATP-binding protein [Gammaproteobacteria bacterium]|nr:ABC transporter ATP-binding protein [Gammaproteobacteria bacterium]
MLEIRDLVKHYRDIVAVDGISFSIAKGLCFGLLGPNGAGKTTTVEMLEGVNPPTRGEILYRGSPIGPQFKEDAGIMFQHTALQDHITGYEALSMFQQLYRRSTSIGKLIEQYSLQEILDRDTRKLSGGQRQRLLLAIAMINDPSILFLDEPTTGLDPQSRRNFWRLVKSIKGMGKTVVLTTHYMEEAYLLCDEIAIMDHGRIIAQGTPDQLLAKHFNDAVLVLPEDDFHADIEALPNAIFNEDGKIEILSRDVNATIIRLLELGTSLSQLQIRPRTLEDLFLELTGKELRS